jgi:hypothetical protein
MRDIRSQAAELNDKSFMFALNKTVALAKR